MNNQIKDIYSDLWHKAARDCKNLSAVLKELFPDLRTEAGHGAYETGVVTGEHERGSADLFLYDGDEIICAIEVTGSDKINMRKGMDIWIRPDKVEYMRSKQGEFPVFAFMIYRNCQRVLTLPLIDRFNSGQTTKYLRGSDFYSDTFVKIKFEDSLEPSWLFKFIAMTIKRPKQNITARVDVLTHSAFNLEDGDLND